MKDDLNKIDGQPNDSGSNMVNEKVNSNTSTPEVSVLDMDAVSSTNLDPGGDTPPSDENPSVAGALDEQLSVAVNALSSLSEKIDLLLYLISDDLDGRTIDTDRYPLWKNTDELWSDELSEMVLDSGLRPHRTLLLRAELVNIATGLIWNVMESTKLDQLPERHQFNCELNEWVEELRRLACRLARHPGGKKAGPDGR